MKTPRDPWAIFLVEFQSYQGPQKPPCLFLKDILLENRVSRKDQSIQSLFIESTKATGPGPQAVGDSQTENHYHTCLG